MTNNRVVKIICLLRLYVNLRDFYPIFCCCKFLGQSARLIDEKDLSVSCDTPTSKSQSL